MIILQNITFLGDSLENLKGFPSEPKQRLGYQLHLVQQGETPLNWKSVPGLGKGISGVKELRERTNQGFYRVVYVASLGDTIYVLHAFTKQSNRIERRDLDIIRQRYKSIQKEP